MRYNRKDGSSFDNVKDENIKHVDEGFMFLRSTDGFQWISELTFNELKLLILLANNGTYKSEVEVGDRVSKDAEKTFGMSYQTLRRSLVGLEDKCFIKKKHGTLRTYLILPATMYKGRSNDVGELIHNYLNYGKKDI